MVYYDFGGGCIIWVQNTPFYPPKEVIKTLEKFGFYYVSQKGSHMKYAKDSYVVIIPNHSEVAKGTLKSILSMAHIELEDFLKEL